MRILAFDCAGAQCAGAVMVDNEIVAAKKIAAARGHAQLLIPLLQELLAQAALTFQDIDRFAVTTGPGSFTGIRVALAAAHGLALGVGKPIVGVTVFESLARSAAEIGAATPRLLTAVESRRAECFLQLFDAAANPLTEPAMLSPEAVLGWIGPGPVALTGDAAWRIAPHLADAVLSDWATEVDPAIVARLAAEKTPGAPPAPFYLRDADAVPSRAGVIARK